MTFSNSIIFFLQVTIMSAVVQPLRGVAIEINLTTEFNLLCGHLQRLIDQVEPQYRGNDNKTTKIQKEWYSKQVTKMDLFYGIIHFSVTNRYIYDDECKLDQPNTESKDLVYTLHIKQTESDTVGAHFVSANVRFASRRGEFGNHKVDFNLYGGGDIESARIFKDFIAEINAELSAFDADSDTFIARNVLCLRDRLMHHTN